MSDASLITQNREHQHDLWPTVSHGGKLGAWSFTAMTGTAGVALFVAILAIALGALGFTGVLPSIGSLPGFWMIVAGSIATVLLISGIVPSAIYSVKSWSAALGDGSQDSA